MAQQPAWTDHFCLPDYDRSVVNLITSLSAAQAPAVGLYPPLPELAELRIDERPVVLLVIDGLGHDFLQRFPDSHLAQYCQTRLTSVFPTTTATAMTAWRSGSRLSNTVSLAGIPICASWARW